MQIAEQGQFGVDQYTGKRIERLNKLVAILNSLRAAAEEECLNHEFTFHGINAMKLSTSVEICGRSVWRFFHFGIYYKGGMYFVVGDSKISLGYSDYIQFSISKSQEFESQLTNLFDQINGLRYINRKNVSQGEKITIVTKDVGVEVNIPPYLVPFCKTTMSGIILDVDISTVEKLNSLIRHDSFVIEKTDTELFYLLGLIFVEGTFESI